MRSIFESKCVKRAVFCILQEFPWTDMNALIIVRILYHRRFKYNLFILKLKIEN